MAEREYDKYNIFQIVAEDYGPAEMMEVCRQFMVFEERDGIKLGPIRWAVVDRHDPRAPTSNIPKGRVWLHGHARVIHRDASDRR